MIVPDSDLGIIPVADRKIIRIGRVSDGNDLVLPHPAVSGHHAELSLQDEGIWWVNDLESDQGVYVNYERVGEGGRPISIDEDILWIPPYAFELSYQEQPHSPNPAHLRLDLVNVRRLVGSKVILDISGAPLSFRPGEFIAIVGGSGAGKTTLLKSMLGMDTLPAQGREGDVYFNNLNIVHNGSVRSFTPLNSIIGYVPQQDDSMHFQLSAREALEYSAILRFASDIGSDEIHERVQSTLAAVQLDQEDLQSKPIHQLSGGQRKRVNIAMELIAQPRLLFLDEPTSGLDPGLDLQMMQLMREWAKGDQDGDIKTIILITHATENIRLCDYIVLLGGVETQDGYRGGVVLYFGSPEDPANEFFGRDTFSKVYLDVADPKNAASCHRKLTSEPAWRSTLWDRARTTTDIEVSKQLDLKHDRKVEMRPRFNLKKFLRQFRILSKRFLRVLSRDRGAFTFQLLQGILVALLLWSVASQSSLSIPGIREAPTTLFIMSIAATWLGMLNGSKEIVRERRIFGREKRYGVSPMAYVLSKASVLAGLGVWQVGGLVAFTMLYFSPENHIGSMGRILPEGLRFPGTLEIEWFVTLLLLLMGGASFGLAISAFARSLDQATMLMFPGMLIQVLLAGLLFDVGPVAWLAFTHWGIHRRLVTA